MIAWFGTPTKGSKLSVENEGLASAQLEAVRYPPVECTGSGEVRTDRRHVGRESGLTGDRHPHELIRSEPEDDPREPGVGEAEGCDGLERVA